MLRMHELLARMHVHVTCGWQIWHSFTGCLLKTRSNVNTGHCVAHRGATCVGVWGGVGAVLCVCVRLSLALSLAFSLSVVHHTDPSSPLDLFLLGLPSPLPEEV